jgi:hypothetical protein
VSEYSAALATVQEFLQPIEVGFDDLEAVETHGDVGLSCFDDALVRAECTGLPAFVVPDVVVDILSLEYFLLFKFRHRAFQLFLHCVDGGFFHAFLIFSGLQIGIF